MILDGADSEKWGEEETFDKFYQLTTCKVRNTEEDIWVELKLRHVAHKDRVSAVDIDRHLRQGPASAGATANSAPNAPRAAAYKPNEA